MYDVLLDTYKGQSEAIQTSRTSDAHKLQDCNDIPENQPDQADASGGFFIGFVPSSSEYKYNPD